jgi:hypothetical protein
MYVHTHTNTAEEEIPANFKKACKGNVEKAGRKWLASRHWREENDIGALCASAGRFDSIRLLTQPTPIIILHTYVHTHVTDHILERAHPNFDTLKQVYPNFVHGRDLAGNAISVEQPGP